MRRARPHTMRSTTDRSTLRTVCALAVLACLAGSSACSDAPERPNVAILLVDTLRADRVAAWGYPRPTTPNIDAICARGVRFANATATSSWTVPSHASLFTGLYPRDHGANQEHPRLRPGLPTLPEILRSAGYVSYGVSGNPLVGRITGLDRGFDHFVNTVTRTGAASRPDSHPVPTVVRRMLAEPRDAPFLLFVNLMDAHSPNRPGPLARRDFVREAPAEQVDEAATLESGAFYAEPERDRSRVLAVMSDLYDAEVSEVDAVVGEVVEALREAGALEDTLLVVTSDHGESLGEGGHLRHAFHLSEAVLRVPLCIVPPESSGASRAGEVREQDVSLVDVFATVLASAGVGSSGPGPGRDLLGDLAPLDGRVVFAEYYVPLQALRNLPPAIREQRADRFERFHGRLRSAEREGLRLVVSTRGEEQLFEVGSGREVPGDARAREAEAAALRDALAGFAAEDRGPPPPDDVPAELARRAGGGFGELDEETAAQLRTLGYLEPEPESGSR